MSEPRVLDVAENVGFDAKPIEITTPTAPLRAQLVAGIFEGDNPTNGIIRIDRPSSVRVHWWLQGPLAECICGNWCVQVHLESIGSGPEFELPPVQLIPLDPCGDGHYETEVRLTPGKCNRCTLLNSL